MISIITNLAYAVSALFTPIEVSICLVLLAIGSGGYHICDENRHTIPDAVRIFWRDMDFYAMYIVFASTIFHVAPLISLGIVPLSAYLHIRHTKYRFHIVGALWAISWAFNFDLFTGIVFGFALIIRQSWHGTKHQDWTHGLWHILTAYAIYLLTT